MTVLDTFYILFKSNAEDVKKGMTDVEKKSKETEKSLKNSNELADQLGKSFVKMVEAGAALTAGYLGVDAIKNGILDVAKFNAGLGRTADLAGQSAQSLKQMGQAAFQAGGSRDGAIQNIQEIQAHYAALGKIITPEELMEGWRQALTGKNKQTQAYMLQQFGVKDIGLATQAEMASGDFRKNWLDAGANTVTTDADIKAAQNFLTEMSETSAAFEKLEQTIGTPLLSALGDFIKGLNIFISRVNNPEDIKTMMPSSKIMTQDFYDNIKNGLRPSESSLKIIAYPFDPKKQGLTDFFKEDEKKKITDEDMNKYLRSPSLASTRGRSPSPNPPSLDDPMTEWQKAVTNPDYIKSIQSTGQSDIYATEAGKAFASQVNHINKGSSNTINVQSVTVNTQATDGQGTADAFQAMLHDLAANHSDGVSK